LKSKGDRAFSQDDLFQAISYYTDALCLEPDNEEVLGCRSAVYSKLCMYNEAKNDAERLIIAVANEPKVSRICSMKLIIIIQYYVH
jgi:Flp pilus assembly protein TadD